MPSWGIVLLTGFFTLAGTIVAAVERILVKRAEIKMKKADIKGQLRRDSIRNTLKLMKKYGTKLSEEERKEINASFQGYYNMMKETEKGIMNDH